MTPKVSILVPIYNVQPFIERCVRSLMQQTFQDLEYIFVDDASTDNSLSILQSVVGQYPTRKHQVQIISHSENRGVAAARTTALNVAQGEYLFWCDSDDWVDPDYCSIVYTFAKDNNSDLVICDFYREVEGCTEIEFFKEFKTYQSLIDNPSNYWWVLFCRFMKRSVITDNQLSFYPQIDMWEDVGFSVRLHYYAQHITYLHTPYYHYNRLNSSSILSQNDNPQSGMRSVYCLQRTECIRLLAEFFASKHIYSSIFLKKARIGEVDSILVFGEIERLKHSYRDLIPFFMHRTELSYPYRLCVSCAMLGVTAPLRFYRYLSRRKHS